MKRDRFLAIMCSLPFCKSHDSVRATALSATDKIKFVVDYFNDIVKSLYYSEKELSLDEVMVLWRGHLQFRQYIKGKRHKYGVKLYTNRTPGIYFKIFVVRR